MSSRSSSRFAIVFSLAAVPLVFLLGACSMNIEEEKGEQPKKVEITTPVGELKVRKDKFDIAQVGVAAYPGAREAADDEDSPGRATVSIATSLFGLKVVAASYETDDQPRKVLDFYRQELSRYGKVTECHGDIDFRDDTGEVVCKPERGRDRDEVELVAGSQHKFRVVGVRPKGTGTKFGVALVQLRGERETM
ncbi:MAG TPA: hypothetical protein VNK82_10340 [Terriglobales bacterium]|nr:hypothetical protein [Terriglobales bacterium]